MKMEVSWKDTYEPQKIVQGLKDGCMKLIAKPKKAYVSRPAKDEIRFEHQDVPRPLNRSVPGGVT